MIPTLRTDRLILRALRDSDAQPWAELTRDSGVHRNVGTFPSFFTPLHAEMRMMVGYACNALGRVTNFGVECDGTFIGTIGISHPSESSSIGGTRHEVGRANIGYGYARAFWGKGIASEACRAVIDWAESTFLPEAYVASYYLDNPASGRVLEKMGFEKDGEPEPHFCMGRMEYALSQNMILPRSRLQTVPKPHDAQAA
jgi:RimJ/RimL family protein N-acetyltransferase